MKSSRESCVRGMGVERSRCRPHKKEKTSNFEIDLSIQTISQAANEKRSLRFRFIIHPTPLYLNLECFNQYPLYLLFKSGPSKFGRQDKQVGVAKGGRKKKSPLRTKSTEEEERETVTATEDHSNHPRVQTGFSWLKTTIVVKYTQTHSLATVSTIHTQTHTHTRLLLRKRFFSTQLRVHVHTYLHSLGHPARMAVCTRTLTHARVTIKYTCWGCDSMVHLDMADVCACVLVCVRWAGINWICRLSHSTETKLPHCLQLRR